MYPSGVWRGYWDQQGCGRQLMGPLALRFRDGRIEGEGRDVIGRFTFAGEYDDHGAIRMVKQYLGRHQVLYQGTYDGEGTIFGEWRSRRCGRAHSPCRRSSANRRRTRLLKACKSH